jgi:hypothetical protein
LKPGWRSTSNNIVGTAVSTVARVSRTNDTSTAGS